MLMLLAALALAELPADHSALSSQLSPSGARLELHLDEAGRLALARGNLGPLGDPIVFLRDRAAPLGLLPAERHPLLADERDPDGSRHVRLSRSIHGLPVEFDQVRIHSGANDDVSSLEAELSPLEGFEYAAPTVAPGRAVELASGGYRGQFTQPARTDLVVVGSRFDGIVTPRLAWRVYLAFPPKPGKTPVIEHVYLDAHNGRELGRRSQVATDAPIVVSDTDLAGNQVQLQAAQSSKGVLLEDTVTRSASSGVTFVLDGRNQNSLYVTNDATSSFGDPQAASVGHFMNQVLAFDLKTFGWDHWDFSTSPARKGGALLAIAHYGQHYNNAHFTKLTIGGTQYGAMEFGDGDGLLFTEFARCLDVTGHEVGHAIVDGTAGLVYQLQSGALNEHFADVFGWLVDPDDDTIGEDCRGSSSSHPLRDMCHPANGLHPQPETMAGYQTMPASEDNGGVHANSGIPNRAACLFRDATDLKTVGAVWFRALSQHLGPTSGFADMVNATATSCAELSLGPTACGALAAAWSQVGLAASSTGGTCPVHSTEQDGKCVCDAGYHVNSTRDGCEANAAVTCPEHAHAVGTDCYCDTGYSLNQQGNGCVPSTSDAACGAHAHKEGSSCACDDCFQLQSTNNGESSICVAVANCATCTDPLQVPSNGVCTCEAGTTLSGGKCVPVQGSCGRETYAGRCVGSTLIYCDDVDSKGAPLPASQVQIGVIDCSKNTGISACGLTSDGYDCTTPPSSCGAVPSSGVCASDGRSAQLCDGSSGTVRTYDCGSNGCSTYTYQGSVYTFCNLCPPHATYDEASTNCTCDSGYVVDGKSCVASAHSGGGSGGTGGSGGGGAGGGTGSTSNPAPSTGCSVSGAVDLGWSAALLAVLALVRGPRRRLHLPFTPHQPASGSAPALGSAGHSSCSPR